MSVATEELITLANMLGVVGRWARSSGNSQRYPVLTPVTSGKAWGATSFLSQPGPGMASESAKAQISLLSPMDSRWASAASWL